MSDVSHDGTRMVALQIDDYGPWTTTPEPRRETDLQALQSRLFATVADFFARFDGYAFADRYDNMIGVANGAGPAIFERLQTQVANQYPVTVSVGVGTAGTPRTALEAANGVLQQAGSAQDADRTEVHDHRVVDDATAGTVTIAHFDVVDATGTLTDRVSSAEASHTIRRAVLELREQMWERHGAVTQFVGGDNAIAVCPSLTPSTRPLRRSPAPSSTRCRTATLPWVPSPTVARASTSRGAVGPSSRSSHTQTGSSRPQTRSSPCARESHRRKRLCSRR